MELFTSIVNYLQPLIIVGKSPILNVASFLDRFCKYLKHTNKKALYVQFSTFTVCPSYCSYHHFTIDNIYISPEVLQVSSLSKRCIMKGSISLSSTWSNMRNFSSSWDHSNVTKRCFWQKFGPPSPYYASCLSYVTKSLTLPSPCWLKTGAIISGIYQKDVLTYNLCDFTAILLMFTAFTILRLFYGYFTNVNCTEVWEEIHDNSDNSDVIVLLKTEHTNLFKGTT